MHVLVLADQENNLLSAVINEFREKGVEISLLSQKDVPNEDEQIKHLLQTIADEKGEIDSFLCLSSSAGIDEKIPFFFAKHLSRYFHRSEHPSRKAFVITLSLDGAFGLENVHNWSPENGSLTGLVKTLQQEWPWVYTRIVDLSPELENSQAANHILSEWMDADRRLVEVGITKNARHTIEFTKISQT
ncbi:MAG: hypothetical protein V2J07_04630 [Anaerolineae bacterium]|jgi:hypothetical protein|nr:hypothetical protein [Anaerolineae bacterium]